MKQNGEEKMRQKQDLSSFWNKPFFSFTHCSWYTKHLRYKTIQILANSNTQSHAHKSTTKLSKAIIMKCTAIYTLVKGGSEPHDDKALLSWRVFFFPVWLLNRDSTEIWRLRKVRKCVQYDIPDINSSTPRVIAIN